MTARRDYLGECNEHHVPLDQFQEQFCGRCVQPECSRSQFGKTKFDQRVSTWEERLFTQVPRMPSSDPRFVQISAKQFKMFDPGPTPSVSTSSAWMDPRDIVEPPAPQVIVEPQQAAPVPVEEDVLTDLAEKVPESTAPAVVQPQNTVETRKALHQLALTNTSGQGGRMLGGAPPPAPKAAPVPKDAWEPAKEQPKPSSDEPVVRRGATVRLGGGSGVE